MKLSILSQCATFFLLSIVAFAEVSQESSPQQITDLLSVTPHSGEGSLIYTDETSKETITFGIDTGIYALGLVLKSEWLPEPYKNDLSNYSVIQITFGTVKSKLDGKVPQFGVFTLLAPEFPKETVAFLLPEAGKSKTSKTPQVRGLFMSPRTLLSQSEKDKVETTLFGNSGGVTLTPVGQVKKIAIQGKDNKTYFNAQTVKLDFQMQMSTPFSNEKKSLSGSISFPVYAPSGKTAESLAMKLGNSLEGVTTAPKLRNSPERTVTGSKSNSLSD
ncbi:MAG: hypothetical protein EBR01_01550 [Proteobacteria bacterium]|nr:hypothetical protein [Pseudomonadota bacterium]